MRLARRGRLGHRRCGVLGAAVAVAVALAVALVLSVGGCSASVDAGGGSGGTSTVPAVPATAAAPTAGSVAPSSSPADGAAVDISAELADLESTYAARVGVSALDTATGRTVASRADERFGYASTLKVFAAFLLLRDTTPADRDTLVTYTQADVDAAGYSPVTSEHETDGLTLAQTATSCSPG